MKSLIWDRIGSISSAVCAVHCVLTAAAFATLSALGMGFFKNKAIDYTFLAIAIGVGGLAAWQGFRRHRQGWVVALFAIGLGLLLAGNFLVPHSHDGHKGFWHPLLMAVGGAGLVAFHVANMRARATCGRCGEVGCGVEPMPDPVAALADAERVRL